MAALRTSIALATYQGGRYLAEQLENYRNQARLPDEVLISDDHSTDDTDAIVKAFA
jgi:glycosyltransferase involved in cell wall biosynthesis